MTIMGNEASRSKQHTYHTNGSSNKNGAKTMCKPSPMVRRKQDSIDEVSQNGDAKSLNRLTPRMKRRSWLRPSIDRKSPRSIRKIPSTDNSDLESILSIEDQGPNVSVASYKTSGVTSAAKVTTRLEREQQNGGVVTGMDNASISSSKSLDITPQRRSRFKDLRYRSIRGTSSTESRSRKHMHEKEADVKKSNTSLTMQQVISEEELEKLKYSKKGRRIFDIISTQTEMYDLYKFREGNTLNLTLNPLFDTQEKKNEITCHSLDVKFIRLPDNKIEETRSVYEVEITFSEAKFRVDPNNPRNEAGARLLKAHSFVGKSNDINLTNDKLTIVGNFYNPEFGKMDFFKFEVEILPLHIRSPDFVENEETEAPINNNISPGEKRKAFKKRYVETRWGIFNMILKGSYSSKELNWYSTERPTNPDNEETKQMF